MKPFFNLLLVALAVSGTVGCSMCCGPYDFDYPTFGGMHERADRSYGRVGSIFSDPYAAYQGEPADANRELPEGRATGDNGRGDDAEAEENIRRFRRELESIEPQDERDFNDIRPEELPQPDDADQDPTANRTWQRRARGQWR